MKESLAIFILFMFISITNAQEVSDSVIERLSLTIEQIKVLHEYPSFTETLIDYGNKIKNKEDIYETINKLSINEFDETVAVINLEFLAKTGNSVVILDSNSDIKYREFKSVDDYLEKRDSLITADLGIPTKPKCRHNSNMPYAEYLKMTKQEKEEHRKKQKLAEEECLKRLNNKEE